MLATDREQQLALLARELLCVAAVAPSLRMKRREPARAKRVVPALERRHRVGARRVAPRRAPALLRQRAQLFGQLAAAERTAAQQRADHLRAKQRDLFGRALGLELFGHVAPF